MTEAAGRRRGAVASVLLLASLTSSGVGLVFLVAYFGRTIFDPSRRIRVLATIPPTAAYAVWYIVVGHKSVGQLADLPDVVKFVVRGVAHSTGEFTGLGFSPEGRLIGLALVVGLMIATGRAMISGRPRALAAGCLLAVPVIYFLAGVVRAQDCADCPTRSRYAYVIGFLLVLSVTDWLPELRARMSFSPHGRAVGVGFLTLAIVVSTAANVGALRANRAHFQYSADLTRAHIAIALAHRGESWIDPNAVLGVMPRVPVLLETVEKHGFPLTDSLARGVDPRATSRAYETALLGLVGDGFRVEPAARNGQPVPIPIVEADHLVGRRAGECISLRDAGKEAGATFSAQGGTRVRLTSTSTTSGTAALARDWPPSRLVAFELAPRSPLDIVIPDVGDRGTSQLRLELPNATGQVRVCGVRLA